MGRGNGGEGREGEEELMLGGKGGEGREGEEELMWGEVREERAGRERRS